MTNLSSVLIWNVGRFHGATKNVFIWLCTPNPRWQRTSIIWQSKWTKQIWALTRRPSRRIQRIEERKEQSKPTHVADQNFQWHSCSAATFHQSHSVYWPSRHSHVHDHDSMPPTGSPWQFSQWTISMMTDAPIIFIVDSITVQSHALSTFVSC